MNTTGRQWRALGVALGMALAAMPAAAQQAGAGTASPWPAANEELIRLALGVAAALAVLIVVAWFFIRHRAAKAMDESADVEIEGSRFEQLLAEVQGLTLRIGSGESKGSYRKIERLARIFLERTGHPKAREMSEGEIQEILRGGGYAPDQASALISIFERCQRGSENEGKKLEFTAAEVLRDLKALIRQVETGAPTTRRPEGGH